jgi:hypothetical protein
LAPAAVTVGEFTGDSAGAGLVAIAGATGQAIAASGSIKTTTGLIYGSTNLILSSSVGSVITASGTLKTTSHVVENATQSGVTVDTTAVVVDSFLTTDYRVMKYIFTVSSGSYYQTQETLVMHSGTRVEAVEYAFISLPSTRFLSFTASITGSTLNIIASGSTVGNNVKLIRNAVVI